VRANTPSTSRGGGGRVAVKLTTGTDFDDISFQAYGNGSNANDRGTAGTVYLEHANHGENQGTLIVDNNNVMANAENVTTLVSSLVTDTEVGDVIIQNAGKLQMDEDTELTVHGDWVGNAISNLTGGTVIFAGSGSRTITSNTHQFNNMTFDNAGGTWMPQDALTVNGNFTIAAGTFDVSETNCGDESCDITLAGDWSNSGTFTARTGTVTFNGTDQAINGSTTFYNFTKVRTVATGVDHTLTFEAGSTQTITNTWNVEGLNGDNRVALYSSDPETHWEVDPDGARVLKFLRVADSNNINEEPIDCADNQMSIDEGNNINWGFSDLNQNDWRWFIDSDDEDVTDPWGDPDLNENQMLTVVPATNQPPMQGDELRMRINISAGQCAMAAESQAFKAQYARATDCTAPDNDWIDIDEAGGPGIWRYAMSSVTDGTPLSVLRLSTSDVLGRYVKSKNAGPNPLEILQDETSEWDFHIEHNGGETGATYCFRVVKDDGNLLEDYGENSFPKLHTKPDTSQLLRHGNVFMEEEEQGYTWAD
jgi:hypothetical protein